MRLKASAYKLYGDSAVLALTLEALPKIAAQVAAPLAKTDEIVILNNNGNNATDALTSLVAQLPPALHAITGIDISGVLGKVNHLNMLEI
jgi:flotillin